MGKKYVSRTAYMAALAGYIPVIDNNKPFVWGFDEGEIYG